DVFFFSTIGFILREFYSPVNPGQFRKTTGPFFWNVTLTHSIYTGPLPSEGLVTLFQVGAKM
ncbi:hypothetical protein, partial [Acetobacter fabarum]|uniref:hypothetical protein n=1 Tax=Acetobacter fabarum TaxID=483199 RepID=UPI0033B0E644